MEVVEYDIHGRGIYTTKFDGILKLLSYVRNNIDNITDNDSYMKIYTNNYTTFPIEISVIDNYHKGFVVVLMFTGQPVVSCSSQIFMKTSANDYMEPCINYIWKSILNNMKNIKREDMIEYDDIGKIIIEI
jgi:hypothetical protein